MRRRDESRYVACVTERRSIPFERPVVSSNKYQPGPVMFLKWGMIEQAKQGAASRQNEG